MIDDNAICAGCVDVLDGLLDEVERLYPFLTLLVNRTYSKSSMAGVVDGGVNLTALDCVAEIDQVVAELADHVADATSFIDFPRDVDGSIFDGAGMVTAYDVPLPMGGQACPTLRRVVWLRASEEATSNLSIAAKLMNVNILVTKLKRNVQLADSMVTSKAGRVLLGACTHCSDPRDLWLERGAQEAVCRSCWKMNTLRDNFLAAVKSGKTERVMTAPSISMALKAVGIEVPAELIAIWEAKENRRVKNAEAKGKVVEHRLPVKDIQEFKDYRGNTRARKLYSFEDVQAYWLRLHELKIAKARKAAVVVVSDDEVIFEVTVN